MPYYEQDCDPLPTEAYEASHVADYDAAYAYNEDGAHPTQSSTEAESGSGTVGNSINAAPPSSSVAQWSAESFLLRQFPPKEPLVTRLLHRRDLVTLGARRRNGKTSFVTNLAVAGAVPVSQFLGYPIPAPWRSLLFILEDDAGEYQQKLRRVIGTRDTGGRIVIVTREDFLNGDIRIDVGEQRFRHFVELFANLHQVASRA
jgi:hypothetical protein